MYKLWRLFSSTGLQLDTCSSTFRWMGIHTRSVQRLCCSSLRLSSATSRWLRNLSSSSIKAYFKQTQRSICCLGNVPLASRIATETINCTMLGILPSLNHFLYPVKVGLFLSSVDFQPPPLPKHSVVKSTRKSRLSQSKGIMVKW